MTAPASIGPYCTVGDDVVLGADVVIHGFANLYDCVIGDHCRIGPFVEIQSSVTIGNNVRIQSHSFLCSAVTLEDDVFIGHNVCFTNDRYPDVESAESGEWVCEQTIVRRGVSIGSASVILPGVDIGEGSIIGAGSVVTRSVSPNSVVYGNPGRVARLRSRDKST